MAAFVISESHLQCGRRPGAEPRYWALLRAESGLGAGLAVEGLGYTDPMTAFASDFTYDDLVARAQRLVAEQTSCTPAEALAKMRDLAEATDETLAAVAEFVLNDEVRFD
jgi:hypothetical protein